MLFELLIPSVLIYYFFFKEDENVGEETVIGRRYPKNILDG